MQLKYLTLDTSRLLSKKSEFYGRRRSSTFLISCTEANVNNDEEEKEEDEDNNNNYNYNNKRVPVAAQSKA